MRIKGLDCSNTENYLLIAFVLLRYAVDYGIIANGVDVWVWRRLVARYLGVVEAAGSSPVTQTKRK